MNVTINSYKFDLNVTPVFCFDLLLSDQTFLIMTVSPAQFLPLSRPKVKLTLFTVSTLTVLTILSHLPVQQPSSNKTYFILKPLQPRVFLQMTCNWLIPDTHFLWWTRANGARPLLECQAKCHSVSAVCENLCVGVLCCLSVCFVLLCQGRCQSSLEQWGRAPCPSTPLTLRCARTCTHAHAHTHTHTHICTQD